MNWSLAPVKRNLLILVSILVVLIGLLAFIFVPSFRKENRYPVFVTGLAPLDTYVQYGCFEGGGICIENPSDDESILYYQTDMSISEFRKKMRNLGLRDLSQVSYDGHHEALDINGDRTYLRFECIMEGNSAANTYHKVVQYTDVSSAEKKKEYAVGYYGDKLDTDYSLTKNAVITIDRAYVKKLMNRDFSCL